MDEEFAKNVIRVVLPKLVEESNAPFAVEDVLREFRVSKEHRCKKKMCKILEIISKNKPNAGEYVQEASQLLEKRDPVFCLLKFLKHFYTGQNQAVAKVDMSTSTPLLEKRCIENGAHEVDADFKLQIKERLVQAAASTVSSSRTYGASTVAHAESALMTRFNPSSTVRKNTFHRSWDYCSGITTSVSRDSISAIPHRSQESIIIADLLYCLAGVRASFVEPVNMKHITSERSSEMNYIKFKVNDSVSRTWANIVTEILPLASHYHCIHTFIENCAEPKCGQVLQALGNGLNEIVENYFVLLAQIENEIEEERLSLTKVHFYLRPTMNAMECFASVVTEIVKRNLRGGAALSVLCERIHLLSGNNNAMTLLTEVTEVAAVPYMEILRIWIHKGVIVDPSDEFLVQDNEIVQREDSPEHYSADYWEKRYTIRRHYSPVFLDKVCDTILRTGKYLNVIRQCGKKVTLPDTIQLKFSPSNQQYINDINNAYRFASRNLLEVLLRGNDLMRHLMSVKRYLLLHQGDFISQFMDACEDELMKNVDKVLPMKLENLLGLTLRVSSANQDPYKDDLHCELLTYDLVTQMSKIISKDTDDEWHTDGRIDLTGLECFAFRYDVKWPVSLVLNHIAISKYQMLFRQLFYFKHVERQLCKIWKENSTAKKFSPPAAEQYRSAFTLRQRMMNAIQNIEYYMMVEVIEPSWHIFIQNMKKVENVDQVLVCHQDFLDSCLKNCMLTETTALHRAIFRLCNICLKFCEFIQKSQRFFLDAELKSMVCDSEDEEKSDSDIDFSSQKQTESSLAPSDTFSERVKLFDLEFTGTLLGFLQQVSDAVSEHPGERFSNLSHRINFNSYYNDQLDKLCAAKSMKSSPKVSSAQQKT